MRRLITFDSLGATLVGTLDLPDRRPNAGVLIVSGGNEVRHGAHRSMAMLAQELAAAGLAGDAAGLRPGGPPWLQGGGAALRVRGAKGPHVMTHPGGVAAPLVGTHRVAPTSMSAPREQRSR